MSELSQTTERYAIVHESVILDRSLTGEELRLFLLLSTYDLPDRSNGGERKGFVFPSRRELGKRFGCKERRISQLFEALETKKRIRREFVPGNSSRIHLLHTVVSLPPLQEPCKTTLAVNVQGGLQETDKGPLQEPCNQKNRREDKELKKAPRPPVASASADAPASPSPEQPTKKVAKGQEKPTDPRIKRLVDFFFEKHQEILEEKYHVIGTHDAPAIKRLLGTFEEADLQARMTRYLQDSLEWMTPPMHSITLFEKNVGKYGNGHCAGLHAAGSDTEDTSWDTDY